MAAARRRMAFIGVWIAGLSLTSLLIWVITWYRPPQPAELVLLGAGYEENLAVPHNIYGWQSLVDLAQTGEEHASWSQDLLHVAHPPRVLEGDVKWDELLGKSRAKPLVIYISAQGAADDLGPYLLPSDATGAVSERIRLSALLDYLATLPTYTPKLLILNTTQIASDWRLGILNNDFARALAALEPRVRAIPQLVVLCASDVDQQSAVCEAWRRTTFGHYFLEGLRGAAHDCDNDRRLDVNELQQWVDEQLRDWSRAHRGLGQQTLLLPRGEDGARRARRIDLAVIERGYKHETAPLAASFTPPAQLQAAWQQYEQSLTELPEVLAQNPAGWREYEATLLRYDELVAAGDETHAAALQSRLSTMAANLARDPLPPPMSLQNSLAMFSVSGDCELPLADAGQLVSALWEAAPIQQTQLWAAQQAKYQSNATNLHLLRIAAFSLLVDRAVDDPAGNLARASQIAQQIASPLHPLPVEIQWLAMLDRYLPPAALSENGGERIGRAIRLRGLAEQAAVAHTENACPLAAEVAPWIAADVAAADVQRRSGEDLLFGQPADREQADSYFTAAEAGYRRALARAQLVRTAIATRNRAFVQLPFYGVWLAGDALASEAGETQYQAVLTNLEAQWRDVHALADALSHIDPATIERAAWPTIENPRPLSLAALAERVARQLDDLVERYHTRVRAIATGEVAADWQTTQLALAVPHADWRSRMNVRARRREATRQMLIASANAEDDDAHTIETAADERRHAQAVAYGHGRLALATLGKELFAQSQSPTRETYEQIRHRLDVFSVEQAWWKSSLTAADQIHTRYAELPSRIDTCIKRLADASPAEARQMVAVAEHLVRQIDAAQAQRLTMTPSLVAERVQLCDLAVSLAERTLRDRWYDIDPQAEPYFRRAGLMYLSDAQQLCPRSPRIAELQNRLINAAGLQLVPPARLDITSEEQLSLDFALRASATKNASDAPTGFAVAWLTSGDGLTLVNPLADQRIVRRIASTQTTDTIPFAVRSPLVEAAEASPVAGPRTAANELTLHGFFRGQLLEAVIPVTLHLQPEVASQRPPLPSAAAVSLAAPASLQDRFGDGSGSVAIVLDASGSMGPPQNRTTSASATASKYAEATAALQEVLRQLPAGTKVSLWMFGQAIGANRTAASPEATIKQVQTPIVWNPSDAQQLAQLMAKIRPTTVTPWNESPIVRTILAAKTDLNDATGYKTIVVITDGMDNRYSQDRVANPQQRSISETLAAEFEGSGIALNIVGFKIVSAEEDHARQQFEVVEKLFPPGSFYRVSQSDALAHTLRLALRQRLRFTLQGYDDEQPVAPLELGTLGGVDVWPPAPLMPGSYQLKTNVGQQLTTDISLARGDVLALALQPTTGGLAIERRNYAASEYPTRPSATAAGWRMTLLQSQLAPGRQLRTAIALEQPPSDAAARLAQITPQHVWFDVAPELNNAPTAGNAASQTSVVWRPMTGWPMPVWSVDAANWSLDDAAQSVARPAIRVWWNPDQSVPLAATINRDGQHEHWTDLTGPALQTAQATASIASIAIENHFVADNRGERTSQSCLVVRLDHTTGQVFWAELVGLQAAGAERRFYPSIGATTCLFWPVTADEAERALTGVGIVALEDFKRDAEQRGFTMELSQLPPPDASDVLPTPAYPLE